MKCVQKGCDKYYHQQCAKDYGHLISSREIDQYGRTIYSEVAFCKIHNFEEEKDKPETPANQREAGYF